MSASGVVLAVPLLPVAAVALTVALTVVLLVTVLPVTVVVAVSALLAQAAVAEVLELLLLPKSRCAAVEDPSDSPKPAIGQDFDSRKALLPLVESVPVTRPLLSKHSVSCWCDSEDVRPSLTSWL
jgi:hypothetical protein